MSVIYGCNVQIFLGEELGSGCQRVVIIYREILVVYAIFIFLVVEGADVWVNFGLWIEYVLLCVSGVRASGVIENGLGYQYFESCQYPEKRKWLYRPL